MVVHVKTKRVGSSSVEPGIEFIVLCVLKNIFVNNEA